ncbi:MAG: tetratricopeptide repeat protein [candidate division KSB1 bacterium]|nr:tetratricopeptide repeat protein [candidate division KSB1 bacterium]
MRTFVRLGAVLMIIGILFVACQTKEVTSAKVYIQQDNWDKAIEQLEMAIQLYPNDAEAYYLLGEGMAQKQNWTRMNEMFDKSLAISPMFEPQIKNTRDKNWVNAYNGGVARLQKNDVEGAIESFLTATVIDPHRIDAYKTLSIAYARADNLEKAKEYASKVLEIEPNNRDAVNLLANLHFTLKEYDKVIELEKKALEMNPDDRDAIANLAMAYDLSGRSEEARETYIKALEKNPGDKDLLFNLARLYFLKSDYQEAIKLFNDVLAANPEDYDANLQVGNAYLSIADDYRKKLVEKELNGKEVTPKEREELLGYYRQAIPYMEKALSIASGNPSIKVDSAVYNNLGVAYVNIGDSEKGKYYFDKAENAQ